MVVPGEVARDDDSKVFVMTVQRNSVIIYMVARCCVRRMTVKGDMYKFENIKEKVVVVAPVLER